MNIIDLISDPNLLGRWFDGASWSTWRAVLRAAHALPMGDDDLARFRAVAGDRQPPQRRVRALVVVAGRRAGKDSIASAVATHAACGDYGGVLRPGERASILCLAVDREQAAIVRRYIAAYFQRAPLLRSLVERETLDGLLLNNGVEIVVATSDYRSIRGRTVVCAVMDEAAFFPADGVSSDRDVYDALVPALATLPNAMLIILSSPHKKAGLLYDLWAQHYGKGDDDILVVHGATRTFNPTVPQEIVDRALARDPASARAEWLAQWRDDLAAFLDRELVQAAVDPGVVVRPPSAGRSYRAFCDPSGGVHDSMTAAIAHAEDSRVVLDALLEIAPPFNPQQATASIVALLKEYRLTEIVGDRYGAQWVVEAFMQHGVRYTPSERERSKIYLDALPLFTAGRARLVDNDRLVRQFCALERRVFATGRDRVDHGPNGHDDLCNAASGALVLAAEKYSGLDVWRRLGEEAPRPPPPTAAELAAAAANAAHLRARHEERTALAAGCLPITKLPRCEGEAVVTLHAPKALRINHRHCTYYVPAGDFEIPIGILHGMQWWLTANGVRAADTGPPEAA